MVVLGGGAVSYERGTPVDLARTVSQSLGKQVVVLITEFIEEVSP